MNPSLACSLSRHLHCCIRATDPSYINRLSAGHNAPVNIIIANQKQRSAKPSQWPQTTRQQHQLKKLNTEHPEVSRAYNIIYCSSNCKWIKKYIHHFRTCCDGKIIHFRLLTKSGSHHTNTSLIIFPSQHAALCFIPYRSYIK